jgi:hypothetical protein
MKNILFYIIFEKIKCAICESRFSHSKMGQDMKMTSIVRYVVNMCMYTFFPASQARDLWYPKKAFPTSSGLRFTYKMMKRVLERV